MSYTAFIEKIAPLVCKYAPLYGICVHSPAIAQAVLESHAGTLYKATFGHNYHGLKWREDRVPVAIGKFTDTTEEDRGDYNEKIVDEWFKFANMEDGIHGYFQFINNSNYANLKGVTDPRTYLENIKADNYATDDDYVEKVMDIIERYNLTKYDKTEEKKMPTVFLSAGHGGSDPGAVAYGMKEKEINLQTMLACKEELERHGVKVICSRTTDEYDPVQQEVKEADASGCDFALSIHANAGGGDGFEVFCNPNNANGKKIATLLEKHVKALGQNSRGVKNGMHLYFIKKTAVTAVLVESFFVDNDVDNNIGDTLAEQKRFGVAYAKAILEYLGIAYKEATASTGATGGTDAGKTDSKSYMVRITASALNIRDKASIFGRIVGCFTDNAKLIKKRPDYYIAKGVFTIVEEVNGWGKLKSGKGWIRLKYTERA